MLDLELIERTDPIFPRRLTRVTRAVGNAFFRAPPRTDVRLEGTEHLPAGPAIFSPNHTHKFDFLPIRVALLGLDVHLITWIKARDYRDRAMRAFFAHTGNIGLASRGYVIASDFATVCGRRPTEAEYRELRDHVDTGARLDPALAERLERKSRAILGTPFDPSQLGYREAVRETYFALMQATLERARVGRDAGHHQHIYPQGSTSAQLTPGRTGAVQAALALDVPVVPVGISGCREVFRGSTPLAMGGEIVIRFGAPIRVPPAVVPANFRPFHPDDEMEQHTPLTHQTAELMERINALCDPRYRWAADKKSDAKQGVARFFE